jgi:hypothetical protein
MDCSPGWHGPVSLAWVHRETAGRSASLIEDRGCGRRGRGARGTEHHRDRLVSTGKAALHAVIQLTLQ